MEVKAIRSVIQRQEQFLSFEYGGRDLAVAVLEFALEKILFIYMW